MSCNDFIDNLLSFLRVSSTGNKERLQSESNCASKRDFDDFFLRRETWEDWRADKVEDLWPANVVADYDSTSASSTLWYSWLLIFFARLVSARIQLSVAVNDESAFHIFQDVTPLSRFLFFNCAESIATSEPSFQNVANVLLVKVDIIQSHILILEIHEKAEYAKTVNMQLVPEV